MRRRAGWAIILMLLACHNSGCSPGLTQTIPEAVFSEATRVPPATPAATEAATFAPETSAARPWPPATPAANSLNTQYPEYKDMVDDSEMPRLLARLHWLGHAAFRIDGPPVVYFDVTRTAPDAPLADLIFISHEHSDHYAPEALRTLCTENTIIVTNQRVARLLVGQNAPGRIVVLAAGDAVTLANTQIVAVPAYNIVKTQYHPRWAGDLGFVITFGGETLYFAGDTERIPEMSSIDCDVALLPIDPTYTMDVEEAALAATDIAPRVLVPMCDGGILARELAEAYDGNIAVLTIEPLSSTSR